ncbi:peptidylprolyl isomerase [Rhodoferax sp.]|uniref:peptidylprolyl isomerase n=1 Tax=Rhodoferax sp. TaxID=50421 RepID=UPI00272F76F5|nr:peptidylprolyl isomerase [Rhodoferax sp.]MDP1528859.1 peptidylprolyl isomerase [Rhodoferax sp.]MDP1943545.1 peptidylprolyl isomerase [Rhodoferax sp.]MDP2442050.1 peptidylprolyl isomerase [Rhodoferax sp.]MDZ4206122.1 peptidylprolyl isomerase [Rhodoferax sp.]
MHLKTLFSLARTTLVAATLLSAAHLALAQAAPKVKFATSSGDFVVEVYPDKAPKTVENFLQYVKDKHYDGTVFHRVINNFMVQGGGFDANFQQKPTRAPVVHEGRQAMEKGLRNAVGTLAMARTSDPQSATAQFYINVKDNAFLDPGTQGYGYTVFGRVVSGMDVIDKIKVVPTGMGPVGADVPKTPILINSATLVK